MFKFGAYYLKNTFYPLSVADTLELHSDDYVLVRTEKGEEVVKVVSICPKVAQRWEESGKMPEPLPVVRILSQRDLQKYEDIQKEEVTSFFKCLELVKKHNLIMNLVQCRITFDHRKITFYYTAPERVDFRELLKDLTQVFTHIRIDLRHIGVRDETSIMTGVGMCGKPFCCASFLRKFDAINIKYAKDQGMPITPGKISGTCGRLLCCLNYEYSNYLEVAKGMPPVGSSVMTPVGLGKVCYLQFLNGTVAVKTEDGKIKEFAKGDVEMVDADVNVEIDVPVTMNNYDTDDVKVDMREIKKLEDDRNSSTGNV